MKTAPDIAAILKLLRKTYPDAKCSLDHENPLELMVATQLSAQCTDERVNIVTKSLFRKYRTATDYANAPLRELEQDIRSTGFYRNKARNIQNACRKLVERHGGKVPDTMEALRELDGIGRKTANVILATAFGKNEGIAVDTHVTRLSRRLGLTKHRDPQKIEQDLMKLAPRKEWDNLSLRLIYHGRARCTARKPDCENCELAEVCPKIGVSRRPALRDEAPL
jgi:endonuclease-3